MKYAYQIIFKLIELLNFYCFCQTGDRQTGRATDAEAAGRHQLHIQQPVADIPARTRARPCSLRCRYRWSVSADPSISFFKNS
jgi:hypothetical protein